jgi:hypothetical protein
MISGDTVPTWPRLLAALAVEWLSGHLLGVAERSYRPWVGLVAIWLSERRDRLGRLMLTGR